MNGKLIFAMIFVGVGTIVLLHSLASSMNVATTYWAINGEQQSIVQAMNTVTSMQIITTNYSFGTMEFPFLNFGYFGALWKLVTFDWASVLAGNLEYLRWILFIPPIATLSLLMIIVVAGLFINKLT